MNFTQLGINENIIRALDEHKITNPTEIQEQVIPQIIENKNDLVAVAQTGTGKTAAFCLPLLQLTAPGVNEIQVLVLVPTRELGQQVAREFFLFSKYMKRIFVESVFGGVPIEEQIQKLKRPTHVVVATPGRLLDLINRQAINTEQLRYLVLDEADEMMNMGFRQEVENILAVCSSKIQKLLFTATLSNDIKAIINNFLAPDFKEIRINAEEQINSNIEHQYFIYKQGEKIDFLKAYLSERSDQRGILFCRTKTAAKRIAKQLAGFEVVTDALHGNLNQEMREKVMRGFKKNRINLLIATDIAARGIDVKELDYIIHYHLPENAENYVHRSGRTARAGKNGNSVCMIKQGEISEINQLAKELEIDFREISVIPVKANNPVYPLEVSINLGINQGFNKNILVDFLVEEAGLTASDIKKPLVVDNHSTFGISSDFERQLILNLKGYKIAHRNVKLLISRI